MDNLIYETLNEAIKYNEKLMPAIDKTIDYFRVQKEDKGLELFIPIVDGLKWNMDVIHYTEEWLNENDIQVCYKELKEHLKEMTSALENQDFILLTDILEYEIKPSINNFQNQLKSFMN